LDDVVNRLALTLFNDGAKDFSQVSDVVAKRGEFQTGRGGLIHEVSYVRAGCRQMPATPCIIIDFFAHSQSRDKKCRNIAPALPPMAATWPALALCGAPPACRTATSTNPSSLWSIPLRSSCPVTFI